MNVIETVTALEWRQISTMNYQKPSLYSSETDFCLEPDKIYKNLSIFSYNICI